MQLNNIFAKLMTGDQVACAVVTQSGQVVLSVVDYSSNINGEGSVDSWDVRGVDPATIKKLIKDWLVARNEELSASLPDGQSSILRVDRNDISSAEDALLVYYMMNKRIRGTVKASRMTEISMKMTGNVPMSNRVKTLDRQIGDFEDTLRSFDQFFDAFTANEVLSGDDANFLNTEFINPASSLHLIK